MSTIKQSALFGAAAYRSIVLAATLVVATLMLIDSVAAAQPTLKDVIEKSAKEEEVKKKPDEKSKEKPKEKAKATQPDPDQEFKRGVPRTSVQGFLNAARKLDYERAAEYLDLRSLPWGMDKSQGPQLARHLKIIFDRASLWIDLDQVSDKPEGQSGDGLPSYRDRLGRIKTQERTVDILLQRVPRGDGVKVWMFSSTTVAEIPRLYEQFGFGALGEILPAVIFDLEFLGIQVWLWVGILVLMVLAYLVALVPTEIILYLLRRRPTELRNRLARLVTGPIRLLLFTLIARAGVDLLGPSVTLRAVLEGQTLVLIAFAWFVMRLLDLVFDRLAVRLRRTGQAQAIVLLPTVSTTLKTVVIVIFALVWLDNIGFKVTTLLAGLGLGGLALALGLQKSIENVVAAITLYAAQPVRIGDFCRFGSTLGTVEEIGLRATRVRTLDRTIVNIPNAEFASLQIDNFAKRDMIWYHPQVRLRYDTTPDQIRYILVEIQKLLYAHPKVQSDSASVRFMEFGTYSLDLDVFAYVPVTDYGEFKEIAEDLNLRIIDIVAEAGSHLALPAQTMFQESGAGRDEQRARAAGDQVKEWREQNALYLPRFPQEKIAELQGSLDYPPKGSSGAVARV